MSTRLVIFDFDGTLADTWPWFVRVFDDAAVRYRFRRLSSDELEQLRGAGSREIMRALRVPWWRMPALARFVRARAARDADQLALFAGAGELVRDLAAAGCTLAMVSSNTEATIRRVLGPELAAAFAIYECGASVFGKARLLKRAVRRSGIAPADAIAIGDEVRDIEAARAAGIAAGGVTWGYARADALRRAGASVVFDALDDVRRLYSPRGST